MPHTENQKKPREETHCKTHGQLGAKPRSETSLLLSHPTALHPVSVFPGWQKCQRKVKKSVSPLVIRTTELKPRWMTETITSIKVPYLVCRIIAWHMHYWPLQCILSGNKPRMACAVVGEAQNPFGLLPIHVYAHPKPLVVPYSTTATESNAHSDLTLKAHHDLAPTDILHTHLHTHIPSCKLIPCTLRFPEIAYIFAPISKP